MLPHIEQVVVLLHHVGVVMALLEVQLLYLLGFAQVLLKGAHSTLMKVVPLPHLVYGGQFALQHFLQVAQVALDVAADLIRLVHQHHLGLYQLDVGVYVLLVALDNLLLLPNYQLHVAFVPACQLQEILTSADRLQP